MNALLYTFLGYKSSHSSLSCSFSKSERVAAAISITFAEDYPAVDCLPLENFAVSHDSGVLSFGLANIQELHQL